MSGYNIDIYDKYNIQGNPTRSNHSLSPKSLPSRLSSQLSVSQSRLSSRSRSPRSPRTPSHTGGVNLTPLISALLLAGIKLSLEQNKKTKKVASNSKSTKTKPRRRTI